MPGLLAWSIFFLDRWLPGDFFLAHNFGYLVILATVTAITSLVRYAIIRPNPFRWYILLNLLVNIPGLAFVMLVLTVITSRR